MSIFSDIAGFFKRAYDKYEAAPKIYMPFAKTEDLPPGATNKIPLPHISLNIGEEFLNSILAGVITQNNVAPDVNMLKDLTKIGAYLGLEGSLGALATESSSLGFIIAGLINKLGDTILGPNYRDLEYQAQWANPNRLVGINTAISAYFRGKMSEEELKVELQKEGFNAHSQELIFETSKQLLGLGELINLRFRGIIKTDAEFITKAQAIGYPTEAAKLAMEGARPLTSPGEAISFWRRGYAPTPDGDPFDDMRAQGWSEDRIAAIKGSSHSLPNIFEEQDFTVRQVDNQAIVDKFKLDAFIDEKYFSKAKQLGYTREDAKRIYRYYWNVPSFFVLRQLYSEGKITEQDFKDLLTFSRFTPYWVDKLAGQLKPQLTQGEVKDMYKYQVIGEAEIVPELEKIGMAGDLAERLKNLWTASVKLATPLDSTSAQQDSAKIKESTLAMIKSAYKDGILNGNTAIQHLLDLKYSKEAAEMEIAIIDYEIHQALIKEKMALLKEEVLAGVKTTNDALTEVSALGTTADQLDMFSAELQKGMLHKPHTPTLAEFTAWHKKGIISTAQFYAGLQILGISTTWAPYYLAAAGVSNDDINSIISTA